MSNVNCETCAYLDTSVSAFDDTNDSTAMCRRGAPFVDDRSGRAMWPLVNRDEDWCGEHSALQGGVIETHADRMRHDVYRFLPPRATPKKDEPGC